MNIGRKSSIDFGDSRLFAPAGGEPQIGDVGLYSGHVVIYGGDAGLGTDVWSASHTGGPNFRPGKSSWYGTPAWYRYVGP